MNLYRDEADSVAWHGDRVAQELPEAVVALVSLGATRPFRLRPTGGGPSVLYRPGPGDLLVMGGSCQRSWHHSVPKCRGVGPRISVQFRHVYDRDPGRALRNGVGTDSPVRRVVRPEIMWAEEPGLYFSGPVVFLPSSSGAGRRLVTGTAVRVSPGFRSSRR